ncbi:GspH/FimT family pseudopilin [Henriciella sp.]|uniref:type II secretion system protein n=1 Tax=Henriciella sp. TaxID=1968823 RepID=UPI00260FCF04|nr:GspH/FimT family pseudopilin [Henriciella sp.]
MTRHASLSRQAGMTLVEVMIVVFIVGLVAGVAVMTIPERESPREKAVRELGQAVRDIQDQAILTGDTLALRATDGAVTLLRWDGYEWQATRRNVLELPDGVSVQLVRPDESRAPEDHGGRMLVFDPLGVTEPANLIVSYGAFQKTLLINPGGEVSLGRTG